MAGLALAAGLGSAATQAAEIVNVYTYRLPELIRPLLRAFTKETGIKVNAVFAQECLEEGMRAEGRNSPADLIAVDIGRLQQTVDMGLAQPVCSEAVERNVPAAYRDPAGAWTGLSTGSAGRPCVQGQGEAGFDRLRGAGRSEVEGQAARARSSTSTISGSRPH